jgi:hypothetical protein
LYWSEYQRRLPLAAKPEPRWMMRYIDFRPNDPTNNLDEDPVGWLRGLESDFMFMEYRRRGRARLEGGPLLGALRTSGKRLMRLRPDDTLWPLDYNEEPQAGPWHPHHALRLWRARSMGPVIDVYSLPR